MTDFIQINGKEINLQDALHLSNIGDTPSFIEATIYREVLQQHAEHLGLNVSDEDIQKKINEIRLSRELENAEETSNWMNLNKITPKALKTACTHLVLQDMVWATFSESDLKLYFDEHKSDFIKVDLYAMRLKSQKTAEGIAKRIRANKANFHLEAMANCIDEISSPRGGYIGCQTREELPENLQLPVFSSDPGDLIGPIMLEKGFALCMITKRYEPNFHTLKTQIRDILFETLLDNLLSRAMVCLSVFDDTPAD
jgi:parvulin-like peptidyl-prolyl isomerase